MAGNPFLVQPSQADLFRSARNEAQNAALARVIETTVRPAWGDGSILEF
jgi:hypothetical protein